MTREVTDEKLDSYMDITQRALDKISFAIPQKTHLHILAEDIFDMAQRYVSDAKHFREQGDYVTAYGALNYAHGWLDAGARLGVFDVDHDSELFTVE